jgi:hypothetical protein
MKNAAFVERRSVRRRLLGLIWESDMTPVKAMMAATGWLLAFGSFASMGRCYYVACQFMEQVMPWYAWSAVWTTYACVKTWRLLDGRQRPYVAIAVNTVGAFLFGGIAFATTVARWPYFWLSCFEMVVAIAALWVMMRTTVNAGHGFRGD